MWAHAQRDGAVQGPGEQTPGHEVHLDLMDQRIDFHKESVEILKSSVAVRDQIIEIYEKAMEGTEVSKIAMEMMNKTVEQRKSIS